MIGWLSWHSGQTAVDKLVSSWSDELIARVYQQLDENLEIAETITSLNIDALQLGLISLEKPSTLDQQSSQQQASQQQASQQTTATRYLSQQLNRYPQLVGVTLATDNPPQYVSVAKANEADDTSKKTIISRQSDPQAQRTRAISARSIQWRSPRLTTDPVRLTVSVDQPFYSESGTLSGVSSADVSLAGLNRFLNTLKIGETGQIFIIEKTGDLIASSANHQPYTVSAKTGSPERLRAIESKNVQIASTMSAIQEQTESLDSVKNREKSQRSQQLNFLREDQRQLVQIRPFRLENSPRNDLEWLVVLTVPESEFMAAINRNRLMTIRLCAVALLIAIMLALIKARWLSRPVRRVVLAAERLSQGKWQPLNNSSWVLELSQLTAAFNSMAQQLQTSFETLEYSAYHDNLTGLLNRQGLQIALKAAVSQQDDQPFSLFLIDIDNFQLINDNFGHLVGDQLLIVVAHRLSQMLRHMPLAIGNMAVENMAVENMAVENMAAENMTLTVARSGGDEFCVLVSPIAEIALASTIAETILSLFQDSFRLVQQEFFIKASVGVMCSASVAKTDTVNTVSTAKDFESFLRQADMALHAAKRAGGGQFQLFDAQMQAISLSRLQMVNDLHQALAKREFVLQYQPIVDVKTGAIKGCEALIRWHHPIRGLIEPSVFIPVAEESDLIIDIGWWVMETACHQMQQWQRQFCRHFSHHAMTMSINFSPKQFFAINCLKKISYILQQTRLVPAQIKLEVTEGLFMRANDTTVARLRQFRALGVNLSLDDFGTGYSSLSYLHRFPITDLKIDRAFLEQLPQQKSQTGSQVRSPFAIAEAIVLLGEKLSLNRIAEGVETPAQLSWLQQQGVEQAQGFLFYRPMAANAMTALLAESDRQLSAI